MSRISCWTLAILLCGCTKAVPRDERPKTSLCPGGKVVTSEDPEHGERIQAWRAFAERRFHGELMWTCDEGRTAPPDSSVAVVLRRSDEPVCWVSDCAERAELSCRAGLHMIMRMEITSDRGLLKQSDTLRLMVTGQQEAQGSLVKGDIGDQAVRAAFASPDALRLQQDLTLTAHGSEVSLALSYLEERPTPDHGAMGRGVCSAHVTLKSESDGP